MARIFSPRVQRLLNVLAPEEAYNLGCNVLEVEHVLLALLKSADGLGYIALKAMKINVLMLQTTIEQSMPSRLPNIDLEAIPQSVRLRNVIDVAAVESKILQKDYIGTEHIFLAALREEHSLLQNFFIKAGISLDQARQYVKEVELKIPSSISSMAGESENGPAWENRNENAKRGANSILDQFGRDLNKAAKNGDLDPVVGRSAEIQRLVQTLSRRTKNNPILIGNPGVGKSAIVEGLAQRIVSGNVPQGLIKKKIVLLDLAGMIAGTKYRGEFEERMKRVMKEVRENKNIILFIDEIHTLIGAGGPEGSMEASNMLKPALSRGEIQIIGATTTKEFRNRIEKDGALARRFQKINIEEPSDEDTINMIMGLKQRFENFHHVYYSKEVVEAIVKCGRRYINDRCFPDKAFDILDEAGAAKKIQEEVRPPELDQIEEAIEELSSQKRALVEMQDYEKAALVRDKVYSLRRELDELKANWKANENANARQVTVDDVLSVISSMTGIPAERLDSGESEKLMNMEKILEKDVVGQNEAVQAISSAVRRHKSGVSTPKRPIGSFFFLGPTGVGKTQLAKALAKFLFGTEDALLKFNMSEYSDRWSTTGLIGTNPGYIGYEDGGKLTKKVLEKPYSVVLFDEIEKANSNIFNIMLQILEDGEITDGQGRNVDFKNTVVIFTSNAGSDKITSTGHVGFSVAEAGLVPYELMKADAMEELRKIMSPELLNRLDDIIVFHALTKDILSSIADILVRDLESRLLEQGISIELKPAAKSYLVENGYEPSMGARPMRRLIQRDIEDDVAMLLISGKRGDSNCIVIDSDGEKLKVYFKKSRKRASSLPQVDQQNVEDLLQTEKSAVRS